jgi:hypothetical protein
MKTDVRIILGGSDIVGGGSVAAGDWVEFGESRIHGPYLVLECLPPAMLRVKEHGKQHPVLLQAKHCSVCRWPPAS